MSNHPVHPATVHFPIAFTLLAGFLDTVYAASANPLTSKFVNSTIKTLDIQLAPATFPILSHYVTLLILITSAPAVVSGALELMPVIKRDGFGSKKAKAGILHAVVNDLTVFGAAYNFWTRRQKIGFVPSETNLLISILIAIPATLFAAYLGGQLVYQYGMGIGRGQTKSKKAQ
ncbi:hypothetical protein BU24DRAFT_416595 [Aaosphaeria arxii CBS 175.79]|uniref:DUF2231 domain-containing protein n=1 Tax=Aaosphaeria arxii CBS 175.79 TaxID=1450172 RepID=A0A6A5Y7D0_9PLEO|nr:uncharacterized protein BU24DRAFT_416595 [Aaosphaeria arxii CBS 175.79]KAF2020937.1 hypothetical protein BU24DRAFT_416595 [Aaosphaeria arxii CBS 175.79]